jgi:hypothetical protein
MAEVFVPASATPEESEAITTALQAILKRLPRRNPSVVLERSKWAAVARREALDDRV